MEREKRYLKQWDVFISYASEDRDSVARPLAEGLRHHGLRVWFDEFELRVGDSLVESINLGLSNSSYGVVILSPNFLHKKWTQKELAALISLDEIERRRILPVWHQLGENDLKPIMPMLTDIIAIKSSIGIPYVVMELLRAINLPLVGRSITGIWSGQTGRLRLFEVGDKFQGDYDWNGHEWAGHLEGSLEQQLDSTQQPLSIFKFQWRWDLSSEKGNGFFTLDNPSDSLYLGLVERVIRHAEFEILRGTWAFDHEKLDLSRNISELMQNRPRKWVFLREGKKPYPAYIFEEPYSSFRQFFPMGERWQVDEEDDESETSSKQMDNDEYFNEP